MTGRAVGERAHAATRAGTAIRRLGAALRAHQHRTAAGLLALVVLVYLWPALAGTDVLSPGALLWSFTPWQASAPPQLLRFHNSLLSDVPTSYYPWDMLARDLLHSGTFPAWNPHAFTGTPLFANLSVAWLSPFSLPLWILPLDEGLAVSAALKLWVAAFGTYLLARELRLGLWPGVGAGIAYALCAFDVVWLTHQAHVAVAALLPALVYLTERIVRRGVGWECVALAVVVAAVLAGGHPGTQVHVLTGTLLYGCVRTATTTGVPRVERLLRVAAVGGGMLVGTLLMAVVLLPGMRAAAGTVGEQVRRNGHAGGLELDSLLAAVFPDWWGRPSEGVLAGPGSYNERAFYAGTVALVFAVVALVSPGAWRRKAPFLLLAALGLAVPLNAPVIHALVVELPGFDRVSNQRLLLWFAFAVAVLGAFGLDAVLRAPRQALLRSWVVLLAAVVGGVVAIRAIPLAPGDVGRAVSRLTDRFAARTPGALALASVLRWLIFVVAVAVVLAALRLKPRLARPIGACVALLVALDMLTFAHGYQPMGPRAIVVPGPTPAIAFLQRHVDDGRIVGLEATFPTDWTTVYGLRDARGYDAPQPERRLFRLWTALNSEQSAAQPFYVATISPASMRVLGALGVRYILTRAHAAMPREGAFRALSPVYRGPDATVFENALAAPRAFVARRVHVADDAVAEVRTVASERFDPRRDAVVRHAQVGSASPRGVAGGAVRLVDDANAHVTLRASLPRRGLVVLGDAWARGWTVTVDGRPARALQANVVLRGVVVPAGEHTIEWRYHVPGLRTGAAISGVGLLVLLAWAGAELRGRRRRRAFTR